MNSDQARQAWRRAKARRLYAERALRRAEQAVLEAKLEEVYAWGTLGDIKRREECK